MNIQEVLTEYQFKNVGQFRGIASSLGYSEEYNKGDLRFVCGDDDFRTTVDKIRSYTKHDLDLLPAESASMERICKFFDRDRALLPEYKETLSKEGVDIINWGKLQDDVKDRFTVIDHTNKICYTGKEMYEYALQNGYLLDGKGTKLEKGVLSALTDVKGKPAKVRLTENGISVHYRKEVLVIPDSIFGKKLSKKQQQCLLNGDVIVLSSKKGDIFLQVDKDLNAVVVRSEKELSIPAKIGGYELTQADKYLLVNGFSLDNKILHGDAGYFVASVSMNADKKGYAFSNIQMISTAKAKELLQVREANKDKEYLNEKLRDMQKSGRISISELGDKRYEQLINTHFSKEYAESLAYIKDENPDKKYPFDIEGMIRLKSGEMLEKEGLLPKGTTEKELDEEGFKVKLLRNDIISDRNLDQELKEAVATNDYEKMSQLRDEGYKPSEEVIRSLGNDSKIDEKQAVVIEKIFGIKPEVSQAKEEILKDVKGKVNFQAEERDLDFKAALEAKDFEKMSQLKEQGYQPSKELLQSLDSVPDNTMIAVQKIFGMKVTAPVLNDIKLEQSHPDKDLTRPFATAVNRAFSDL